MYIEQDCSIDFEGKKYECYGAMVTEDKVFAYLGEDKEKGNLFIHDWHGNTLSDNVEIISRVKLNNNPMSNERVYLRFELDGKIYSGSSYGVSMYVKARKTKRTEL